MRSRTFAYSAWEHERLKLLGAAEDHILIGFARWHDYRLL
jgi:hypothetical protein